MTDEIAENTAILADHKAQLATAWLRTMATHPTFAPYAQEIQRKIERLEWFCVYMEDYFPSEADDAYAYAKKRQEGA